jgi:hypothetical protein
MAAPNLKSPTTITGKTASYSVTTTLAAVLSNAANSGKALRINTIRACNITGSTATIDVTRLRSGTDRYLVKAASIEPTSSLVILTRDEILYLEEGDDLRVVGSANATFDLLVTYEEIS